MAILEMDSNELRAAVIVDWTDADSEVLISGSMEDYSLETPSRLSADRQLVSIDELAGISGYSSTDVLHLYPYVATLPGRTPVNINTASAELLGALSSVMDSFLVEEILLQRPFDDLDDFYAFVAESTGYMSAAELRQQLPANMITTSSDFFELLTTVNLVDQQIKMRSLMQRNGGSANVYSREFQSVPVVLSDRDQGIVSTFDCYQQNLEEDES
jgi:general secretion pathway protein K